MTTLTLPADKARCRPDALGCNVKHKCARFLATVPERYGSVMDWTAMHKMAGSYLCSDFLSADSLRRQAEPIKPRVHPPMGGR